MSDTLTRCKRVGCTEGATEHSLTLRSNRYRQLCEAHYEAERAKSTRPQTNGAAVPDEPPDPEPPVVECARKDAHDPHLYQDAAPGHGLAVRRCPGRDASASAPSSEAPEPEAPLEPEAVIGHTPYCTLDSDHDGPCRDFAGRNSVERAEQHVTELVVPGAHERQARPRALRPEPLPAMPDLEPVPLMGELVTLEATTEEWTPQSRIRSAYVGAVEDAFGALARELTESNTGYTPTSLLDALERLLGLADAVAAAADAVADEVPSAG